MPQLTEVAEALKAFGNNPQNASYLATCLGFQPSASPADLLAGQSTPLNSFLDRRFGIDELYRVGGIDTDTGTAGLYVAVLDDWRERSSERDKPRRRLARALVEYQKDARSIFIMVPNPGITRNEAEFVLPRSSADLRKESEARNVISTVRALVELEEPSRFHRELLCELAIRPGASLLDISQQWQQAFSVEKATKKFYQEYATVRDTVAQALKATNTEHPVISQMTDDETRAWATRQLGRILFLWFLQSKNWLGYDWSLGESSKYLINLWTKREQVGGYYKGILLPLFFTALARRNPGKEVREILGYTPYLNGGLFRRNRLEDRVEEAGSVDLPDVLFDPRNEDSVLGLLTRYRFTTRESTPDDKSVDPDPELLGRVFENLYQGDERHDTGTYYTPREIVHFMCRQVLDGYLRDATGVNQETLDWLRKQVIEPDEEKHVLSSDMEEKLTQALEGVQACDPAVGSGAFLLGMMQEIVQLRRGILHSKLHYIEPEEEDALVTTWKRRAIMWSLYGVDINPEAVEICQLRLWLSMVLDLLDPTKVEPLPNLDFRIVAGDSLIDRVADITFTESLPPGVYQPSLELGQRVGNEEQQIDRWRREFEATQDNPVRLKELRENIARAQMRIVRYHLDAEINKAQDEVQMRSGAVSDKTKTVKAQARLDHLKKIEEGLDPNAPYQKPFLWPIAFPEVFDYGGFDIVLANPPYVRQEKLAPEDQESYKQAFSDVFAGTADILTFFYARSMQILKDGGWLAFITSNSFIKRNYGANLRDFLVKNLRIQTVIDFGEIAIFEAVVEPFVLLGSRKEIDDNIISGHNLYPVLARTISSKSSVEITRERLQALPTLLLEEVSYIPQVRFSNLDWRIENEAVLDIFTKLRSQGLTLDQLAKGRIFVGIKTGLNAAFIIDKTKRDNMISEDPRSASIIKPWIRGRDIKRWRTDWQELYVLAIQNSGDSDSQHPWANVKCEEDARKIFRDTYPVVHDHISWWESDLRKRSDQGCYWWELRPCSYYDTFRKPKIVWPDIARDIRFAWDTSGVYLDMTAFTSDELPEYMVCVLNSRITHFQIHILRSSVPGGFVRLKTSYISDLQIPRFTDTERKRLTELAYDIQQFENNSRAKEEAELLIAEAYGVKPVELAIIDDWFVQHRLKLDQPGTNENE